MLKLIHRRKSFALGAFLLGAAGLAGAAWGAGARITQTVDGVPFYDARGEVRAERVIPVANSPVVVATWEEKDASGRFAPWVGISLDGADFARVTDADYVLGMRYAHFDPLAGVPAVPARLASGPDVHLYLVQFVTQPLEEYQREIAARGGVVRQYVAQYADLVEMDAAARARVAELPYVRWTGAFEPAYRLEEYMLENLDRAATAYPSLRYNIEVLDPAEKAQVASRIAGLGARVDQADAGKFLVTATLTPDQLFRVARWDEVLFIDRWSPLEPDMNIAREIGGANYIETAGGYTGQGVRGEVFDQGFNLGHEDFASRPLITHGPVNDDSHGASTSGIVFGDGTGQPNARGMLPSGQGIVADYDYWGMSGPNRYTEMSELVAPPYNAVFQTASVGSGLTTQYTTISAETDARLFDFDFAACQSQSNAGSQSSRPEAWAKNMISGGGTYHYNTLDKSDDCWCGGASIGPASDGRMKPTLCHFYDAIWTTDCCSYNSYTQSFGGTSGATPIIAGHVGLFFQMWSDGIFGNPVDPSGTVFDNRPHAATARAMMINTADQYPFSGTSDPNHARMHQGWGMPSVKNLYDLRDKFFIVDETDLLTNLQTRTYRLRVAPGETFLKITMVYSDPPGNPANQSQHRVNDLTLKATSPAGFVWSGNLGLDAAVWSTPGNISDHKNTEENIFIQNPQAGTWVVRVTAEELIQDGHVETPELDADYALVASASQGLLQTDVGTGPSVAPAKLALRIQGIRPGNPEASVSFTLDEAAYVRLTLHDVTGRRVAVLHEGPLAAGMQSICWNGHDANGARVAPGVYYARLELGSISAAGKLLVVR